MWCFGSAGRVPSTARGWACQGRGGREQKDKSSYVYAYESRASSSLLLSKLEVMCGHVTCFGQWNTAEQWHTCHFLVEAFNGWVWLSILVFSCFAHVSIYCYGSAIRKAINYVWMGKTKQTFVTLKPLRFLDCLPLLHHTTLYLPALSLIVHFSLTPSLTPPFTTYLFLPSMISLLS